MFTRKDYMNNFCSHHEYYKQMITEDLRLRLLSRIGIERIRSSKDEHLNDIRLNEWEGLFGVVFQYGRLVSRPVISREMSNLIKACQEDVSVSTLVCIAKACARELVNDSKN